MMLVRLHFALTAVAAVENNASPVRIWNIKSWKRTCPNSWVSVVRNRFSNSWRPEISLEIRTRGRRPGKNSVTPSTSGPSSVRSAYESRSSADSSISRVRWDWRP